MRTTNITLGLNMGFMDGEEEIKMKVNEAECNLEGLIQHMRDIMPDLSDLDLESDIQQIGFVSLELAEWSPKEDETIWADACIDASALCTYNMRLTIFINHEHPVSFTTAQTVVDAIYENGANCPFTPDAIQYQEMPHTFLYPYHSTFSDLDDGMCIGHECDEM